MEGFSLRALSAEVLSHLLAPSSFSHLALALWKCGDSRLNRKLASCITTMDLRDRNWSSTSRYPKLLSSLRELRSLVIDRGSAPLMTPYNEFSEELRKLTPTLTRLEVTCFSAQNAFYQYDQTGERFVETTYELGNSRLFDLSATFPHLSTLKVHSGDGYVSLSASDFPGLPSTLTKLFISHYDGFNPPMLHCLPRSLTVLEIGLSTLNPNFTDLYREDLRHLPPNLLELKSLYENVLMTDPLELDILPKSLIKVKLDWRFLPWSLPLSKRLPPDITKLYILEFELHTFTEINSHWASKLPHQLTSLIITVETTLSAELTNLLPSTLTRLGGTLVLDSTSFKIGPETDDFVWQEHVAGYWPPRLLHLSLHLDYDSSEWMNTLPRTLTSLFVVDPSRVHRKLSLENFHSLTSFSMGCVQRSCFVYIQGNLPESLATLEIGASPYLGGLMAKHLKFPDSLTKLHIKWSDSGDLSNPLILPNGVRSLKIDDWRWEWLNKLPTSLTRLNVRYMHGYPMIMEDKNQDMFGVLPSGMEYLVIGSSPDFIGSLPSSSFSTLPRLTHLEINKFLTFDSPILRKLSRRLKTLHLTLERLLSQDAPLLPPLATDMDLRHQADPITELSIADHCSRVLREDTVFLATEPWAVFKRGRESARVRSHAYPDPRVLID